MVRNRESHLRTESCFSLGISTNLTLWEMHLCTNSQCESLCSGQQCKAAADNSCSRQLNYWKTLTHVVQLRKIMRQNPDEQTFMGLLQRLRRRECTFEDYALLKSRLVGSVSVPTLGTTRWQGATFIVSRHTLRRAINHLRAKATAKSEGITLLQYSAVYRSTDGFPSQTQLQALRNLSLSTHDACESQLDFHIGMPVVLNENQHTPQGRTNGAYGTVVKIVLDHRERSAAVQGARKLQYPPQQVHVRLRRSHAACVRLSGLDENIIGVEPKEARAVISTRWFDTTANVHRRSSKTFRFLQLPVSPAYAVTDYRAQRDTVDSVVVDLQRSPGGQYDAAVTYVAVSRVTSLSGLAILRPFDYGDIS